MVTPRVGSHIPDGRVWGVDTGCYAAPENYNDDIYLRFLDQRSYAYDRCLFATAPDVVFDARRTLEIAVPMMSRIRNTGYPVALVAQDGMEHLDIPWPEFSALFIGGSTAWKHSAGCRELVREAKLRGHHVHMGRVNSYKRLAYSASIGCDTADGTFLAFGPEKNIPRLQMWLDRINKPQQLLLEEVS